jgi:hypothetical protein
MVISVSTALLRPSQDPLKLIKKKEDKPSTSQLSNKITQLKDTSNPTILKIKINIKAAYW